MERGGRCRLESRTPQSPRLVSSREVQGPDVRTHRWPLV